MSGTSENQPTASEVIDVGHAADNIDDVLLQAQEIVAKWEGFVEEQKQKRAEAAAQLQDIMDTSGLSAKGVDLRSRFCGNRRGY